MVQFILLFHFETDMNREKTRRYTMPQDETCRKNKKKDICVYEEVDISKNSWKAKIDTEEARRTDPVFKGDARIRAGYVPSRPDG